jgi:hypothetical protein
MKFGSLGILLLFIGAAASADIPRTQDGKPDLSGFFDVATITPLQRPEEFGDKLYITVEEAQKIEEDLASSRVKANSASDPNREAPPTGGNVGGYNRFWLDGGEHRFAIDGKIRTSVLTVPANGRYPELSALGKAKEQALVDDFTHKPGTAWWLDQEGPGPYDNMETRPLRERCLLGFGPVAGPPIFPTAYNNHKRIVQTEDYVMILAEMVHDARIIRLNTEHRPDHMRTWLGDSIGHWDGDTLVVDTTNFNATPALRAADENLHVVETFRRVDETTLIYSFTVTDPTIYAASWSGEYPWPQTDEKVYEYACHEGNYSFGNIMRGARILEREMLAGDSGSGGD